MRSGKLAAIAVSIADELASGTKRLVRFRSGWVPVSHQCLANFSTRNCLDDAPIVEAPPQLLRPNIERLWYPQRGQCLASL